MTKNAYIQYSGFSSIYVRKTQRYIGGQKYVTFDLANIVAEKPGNGAFKELIDDLKQRLSSYGIDVIYIENVVTDRFAHGLEKMGFERVPSTYPPCFVFYLGQ